MVKGVAKAIENETKQQKGGSVGIILGTLHVSSLANLLNGKGVIRAGKGKIRAEEKA